MAYRISRLGWIPDIPDQRDFMYAAPTQVLKALPASFDLRNQCPKTVYDQGHLGSCTANAIAGAIEFDQIKQNLSPVFVPSRLFIYYNERVIEGTVSSDSGAMVRDGMKSVGQQGACPEDIWQYNIENYAVQPTDACYQAALQHKALLYQRVARSLDQMKGCLASGSPFIFGFTVYESFESQQVAQDGHA